MHSPRAASSFAFVLARTPKTLHYHSTPHCHSLKIFDSGLRIFLSGPYLAHHAFMATARPVRSWDGVGVGAFCVNCLAQADEAIAYTAKDSQVLP